MTGLDLRQSVINLLLLTTRFSLVVDVFFVGLPKSTLFPLVPLIFTVRIHVIIFLFGQVEGSVTLLH